MKPLTKYGHILVDHKGTPLVVGEKVSLIGLSLHGTLMDAGWPPCKDGPRGEIVINFDGFAVPVYPELIGAHWRNT